MISLETKKLIHWGWAAGEKRMLHELEKQAKEGWILSECTMFHLILKKDVPKNIQYAVDFPPIKKGEEDEYFRYFEETGWHLACKNGCFYIFYADRNAAPIHTDRELLDRLREQRLKKMIPRTIICLLLAAGFVALGRTSMPLPLEMICFLLAGVSGGLLGIYGTICFDFLRIHNNF